MIIVPTIDVEGVHGTDPFKQMILGDVDGGQHGVFEISDILRRNHAEGTFFVDVFESSLWGEPLFSELCNQLDTCEQDVQLHTHPGWRDDPCDFPWLRKLKRNRSYISSEKDFMAKLSLQEQQTMLEEGSAMIKAWIGKKPFAHRSGGYSINRDTFSALSNTGFTLDSSVHFEHKNTKYCSDVIKPTMLDSVFELPITLMRYKLLFPSGSQFQAGKLLKTDIDTSWLNELIHYVDYGLSKGVRYMNLFMHSYSLITFDPAYRVFKYSARKAQILSDFLSYCHKNKNVKVMSCRQIQKDNSVIRYLEQSSDKITEIKANHHILSLGMKMLKNRIYEHGLGEKLLSRSSL